MASALLSAFQSLFSTRLPPPSSPHKPTVSDIRIVKTLLSHPTRHIYLPVEIIDYILDFAEYWASSKTTVPWDVTIGSSYNRNSLSEQIYLRARPLGIRGSDDRESTEGCKLCFSDDIHPDENWSPPRGARPCRKIEFRIWAHDQGWSHGPTTSFGTHHHSYTWFDVGVDTIIFKKQPKRAMQWKDNWTWSDFSGSEMFETKVKPEIRVVNNIHARREFKRHDITWHWRDPPAEGVNEDAVNAAEEGRNPRGGDFVRDLEVGDCVALYAKAQYLGWSNTVQKTEVEIYWAV